MLCDSTARARLSVPNLPIMVQSVQRSSQYYTGNPCMAVITALMNEINPTWTKGVLRSGSPSGHQQWVCLTFHKRPDAVKH